MDLVDELASGSMSLSSAGGTELWNQDLTEIFAQPSLASNQPQASIDMNSHKKKKKRALHQKSTKDYSESYLQSMLNNVKNGRMTMYHVDKYYGIPRGTLQYRLGTKFMNKGRKGPDTVLTTEEEAVVLSWILTMERRGFPVTRRGLVAKVSAYLKQHPRTNPCRNSVPDTPPSDLSNCSSFYKHQETESVSASKFFVAPPSPKRCSKHRFYKQKSYAILTAGERLQELRQIEINKEVAAKEKLEKAEKRKAEKLKKEVAALIRAEEKENARKIRDLKKEEEAIKRAEKKENAKKLKEEKKEKKKNSSKRFDKLLV